VTSHVLPAQSLKPEDGDSVRWCGGDPCVVLAAASEDTSVPGESEGQEQVKITLPHQLQIFNSLVFLSVSVVRGD
jgi:hypothetical protein